MNRGGDGDASGLHASHGIFVVSVLKSVLRERHPLKSEAQLTKMVQTLTKAGQSSQGRLDDQIWRRIISKMYD